MSTHLAGGFIDAAIQSQSVFRKVMRALGEPGRVERLGVDLAAPSPLEPAAAAIVLTLCDFETSLWLAPPFEGAASYLRFHTDTRLETDAGRAAFALVDAASLDLSRFHAGTAAYPDRGATVIVQCLALDGGPELTLAGPGIAATARFAVAGLPADFAEQLRRNRAQFPLGVDMIFVCGADIVALPRSTRVMSGGA